MDKKAKKVFSKIFIDEVVKEKWGNQEITIQEHTTDKTYWGRVAEYFNKGENRGKKIKRNKDNRQGKSS